MTLINYLRLLKSNLQIILFNKKISLGSKYILCRTACLVNDSIPHLNFKIPVYNIQKMRIDGFFTILTNGKKNLLPILHINFFHRADIAKLFLQQRNICFFNKAPEIFLIDSFAELVDQKFISLNDNSFFFSNYSDVKNEIQSKYKCIGLLDSNCFFSEYLLFFKKFRQLYPQTPVVYFLFPKKLETRELFLKRHNYLRDILPLLQNEIEDFYFYDIPEKIVNHAQQDDFPYHYCDDVYKYVSSKIKNVIDAKKLNLTKPHQFNND